MWFLRATTYDKTHFFVKITLLTIRIALIRRMILFLKGKQFHIDISSLNTATWNVIGNLKSTLYDDIKRKKKNRFL